MDTRKIPPPAPDYGPPPKRRGRKVAILVALLVGLPALALAATYLFGTITGNAAVTDSTASVTITDVIGTDSTGTPSNPLPAGVAPITAGTYGGLACGGSGKDNTASGTQQTMHIQATAYRVKVNGTATDPGLSLGTCAVVIVVKNDGADPESVSAVIDEGHTVSGWTFDPTTAPTTINAGQSAAITVKIQAMGNAAGGNTGGQAFTGVLNVAIPPNGSG